MRTRAGATAIGHVLVWSTIVVWLALLGTRGQHSQESRGNASELAGNMPAALFSPAIGDPRFRSLESDTGDGVTVHSGHLQPMPPWMAWRSAASRALLCRKCTLLRSASILSVAPKTSPPAAHPVG